MDGIQDDLLTIRAVHAAKDLVDEAMTLSADYGHEVSAVVQLAAQQPLDEESARSLFTRILVVLRGGVGLGTQDRERVAAMVQDEVTQLVIGRQRNPREEDSGGIVLVARNGLQPHRVTPMPIFNGQQVPLEEGYVDVTQLDLWKGNHRVELYVKEFQERNGREPDEVELLRLVQGDLALPSVNDRDPFGIVPLARSIARKGVERPPIITYEGEPKDGNRRIAAAKYVVGSSDFSHEEKERARWIRVWRAPLGTTEDQFEAIVVALNFEDDHKEPWPEYVKARLVVERYRILRENITGRITEAKDREVRAEVAKQFAIMPAEVRRYLRMVRWAEDFELYHTEERGKDTADVRYKSNDIFQWFYEIDAGRGADKLTNKLDQDDDLKPVVYDLMFDVLESGAEVRHLHKVVADENSLKLLQQAHEASAVSKDQALNLVREAIAESQRSSPTKRLGFEQWLKSAVQRLGQAPPDHWRSIENTELLCDLARVFRSATGAVEGELVSRGKLPRGDQ